MIDKKNLKVGDEVAAIYTEGYAEEGKVFPVVIKKIAKNYIIATRLIDNWDYKFVEYNNELIYESLKSSCFQKLVLFLGTLEEGRKYDKERMIREDFYSQNQDLILSKLSKISKEDLKKIIYILEKY